VIRDDRELLAELARLNATMVPLAMKIMDGTARTTEQHNDAQRLMAAGERVQRRAETMNGAIIEGEVLTNGSLTFPAPTVEPTWER
jgi:hypothetical protein